MAGPVGDTIKERTLGCVTKIFDVHAFSLNAVAGDHIGRFANQKGVAAVGQIIGLNWADHMVGHLLLIP